MKTFISHRIALILGALLLCNFVCTGTYAQEQNTEMTTPKSKWLDPQPKHVGLMWNVGADIVSNYVWRGLYVGGLGVQADFMVGYGGLFLDMWWNVGAGDWTFNNVYGNTKIKLNPEVDMTLGFSRWGLTVMFMHMYYFDYYKGFDGQLSDNMSQYFNFANTAPGGGITQEWRIKYKVSSKLPLTLLWCTRTWGRDGYMIDGKGNQISCADYNEMTEEAKSLCGVKRAYSSYFEINYDWRLPHDITMSTAVGLTPWKSMYTGYQGNFAINNVSVKLLKSWDLSKHCYMTAFANLMMNPYDMAIMANGESGINGNRKALWNVGCGFYLK